MTNITDTSLVEEHDRGSTEYNRRKGEANTATKPKPKRGKAKKADDAPTEDAKAGQ
jgi:hypothetical protein